jgi:dihydrodipicolinate synthase/N-acetylneuraminate lyase
MLPPFTAKVEKDLGETVDMLAEPLDPRHVLVQGDAPDRESRPADFQVLEEDGLEFARSHEIDIGFVLIRTKKFSPLSVGFASVDFMITDPADLKPSTTWEETVWAHTPEEALVDHTSKARLCVATLLPFRDGKPDWEGFENSIRWMITCAEAADVEIAFVLNADTGYIFNLSLDLYGEVIRRFRAAFPEPTIICGSTAVGASGDTFQPEWYRPHFEIAQSFDKVEMMIMTSKLLNELETEKRRDAYFEIAEMLTVPGIVHALEPAFVPWATPYGPWLLHELANHPKFVGGKISTLDEPHFLYWASMCRDLKLDFAPHSGDDFGIASAIKMGLPLLIGAGVSACPLICEAKRMWTTAPLDTRVYKLFEAFQSLEDAVFRLDARGSAAAYKHSTAHVLKLLGLIASSEIHPDCPDLRPADEADRMREALVRPLRIAERLGIRNFRLA